MATAKYNIRWLGAFRKGKHSLYESIAFECSREDEVACEPLYVTKNHGDEFVYSGVFAKIGVLINNKAVFKTYHHDCWSEYGNRQKGQDPTRLYATRINPWSNHAESWAHAKGAVIGIVVTGNIASYSKDIKAQVSAAHKKLGLPVYYYNNRWGLKEAKDFQ